MWVIEKSKIGGGIGSDVALEQVADKDPSADPQVTQTPGIPSLGSVVGDWDGT